ncbi:hypothetical protein MIMGU_mgv1a018912mg, partial [Erythranthe guttata]
SSITLNPRMARSNRDMYAGMTPYFVIPPGRNNSFDNFSVDVEEITRWTPISPGSMRWTATVINMPAGGTSGEQEEEINYNNRGGGLSEQDIENRLKIRNIPSDRKEESETCAEDRKVGILRCRHEYHVDCIGRWLRIKNLCPLCKGSA